MPRLTSAATDGAASSASLCLATRISLSSSPSLTGDQAPLLKPGTLVVPLLEGELFVIVAVLAALLLSPALLRLCW